jgi:hypothetical protein
MQNEYCEATPYGLRLAQERLKMLRTKRALVVGLFVVLAALVAGADGKCNFGGSSDCLIFCS